MFKIITLTFASLFVLITNAYAQSSELPDTVWTKFTYPNKINAVKFTPDGKYLVSGGDDGVPRLWDAETGELIHEFPNQQYLIYDIDIIHNLIAIASPVEGGVYVYNLFDYNLRYKLEPSTNVVFSNDGFYLATTRGKSVYSSGISVYNSENGNLIRVIDFENSGSFDIRISSDNKFIARSSTWWSNGTEEDKYGKVEIYSFPDLLYITTLEKKEYFSCYNLAFSPDGKYLAGATSSSPNKIWKTDDWSLFREFGDDGSDSRATAFSKDSKYIVMGAGYFSNLKTNIYNVETKELIYSYNNRYLFENSDIANAIDISLNQELIAVGGAFGIYMLNAKWNPTSVVERIKIPEPEIFPNPTTGNVYIDLKENQLVESVRINDIKGSEVLSIPKKNIIQTNTKITINLPNFDNGIYLLNLFTNHGIMSYKLIMEK